MLHQACPACLSFSLSFSLSVSLMTVSCCRYGFVVYGDGNVTDVACKGLNGMRMGDRTLTVRRATEVMSLFYVDVLLAAYNALWL